MKRKLLAICLVILIVASCKKETKDSINPNNQMAALVKTYNLHKIGNVNEPITHNFNSVQDLSNFLQKRQQAEKEKKIDSIVVDLSNPVPKGMSVNLGKLKIRNDDLDQVISSGDEPGVTSVQYTAYISSSNWTDMGFPKYAVLTWSWDTNETVSNVSSLLIADGPSFGSYTYNQTSGSGTQDQFSGQYNVSGVYTEAFGVGGIGAYYKSYIFTLSATYYVASNTLTAAIHYAGM